MANRFAGKKVAAMSPGAEGKDSRDLLTAIALAAGVGGLGVTGLASLIDLFTGSANMGNSGEYLANSVISSIPAATGAAGVGAAALMHPTVRKELEMSANLGAMQEAAAQAGREAAMYASGHGPRPNTAATNAAAGQVNESKKQLLMAAAEQARKEGISPEEVINRGRRHMMRAGGLGAAAGAIPALLMMRDAPAGEGN